jgi:hypothetical protein
MPRPLSTPRKDPVPIVQEAGWAPGLVWTGSENLAPHRDSIPGPYSPYPVAIPTGPPGPLPSRFSNQFQFVSTIRCVQCATIMLCDQVLPTVPWFFVKSA